MALKKARVLVDVTINDTAYKPNDVVSIESADLANAKGVLDGEAAAVAYAESLKSAPDA